MSQVLGILGGMGPRATVKFFSDIVEATKAEKDWDHLRIIIDNNVDIPSRTRSILYGEDSPAALMQEACFALMSLGCAYIAVPCNSAHHFFDAVVSGTSIPWINMIEVVAKRLTNKKKVLVLGGYVTITKKLYDKYMDNTAYMNDNSVVYEIIEALKLGNTVDTLLDDLKKEITKIDPDCVLLACTELPIISGLIPNSVSCNDIYINEIINLCGGTPKYECRI